MSNEKRYVPALGYDLLTGFYDPVVAVTSRERTFKRLLIEQAGVRDGHLVLDLACGTGTLAVWIKQHAPGANVVGIDGDPKILARAVKKARKSSVDIAFYRGFSTNLHYENASFDRVVSSLFFHHLSHEDKVVTIQEVFRVLKPGGEFHVADWGKPRNILMSTLFCLVRLLDGFENTRENVEGMIPELFLGGGFENVEARDNVATIFGTMALYSMRKPVSSGG
jgi:ubiquinone/menaquinone biosynthesis C-methylase UbiE